MNETQPRSTILIVDDHPLFRDGLAYRIATQEDLTICGEAATEDEAFALIEQTKPDMIIVDLLLKSGHGLQLIKRVKLSFPAIKMLALSAFSGTLYAERALRAGALGYLNKQESSEDVMAAIRATIAGQRYVSADVSQRLVGKALGRDDNEVGQSPFARLTDRELEVFRLIGEGHTTGVIATKLFLSTHTIDTHRENIKRKLNLKNAGELTRAAVQWLMEP